MAPSLRRPPRNAVVIGAALVHATLVATLALAGVAVHVQDATAECSGWTPVPKPIRTYVGHAFTATVVDAVHRPFSPAYGDAFNWRVTLDVDRAYHGSVPQRLVVEGWDAGCSALQGERLRDGDRLFLSVDRLNPSRFPGLADDLLVWRATDTGWRFAESLLRYGDDPRYFPAEARAASTTKEIRSLVDPDAAPGNLIPAASPSPTPSVTPGASTAPSPSTMPFPWPTLPAPPADPPTAAFEASGLPDATSTRHGVTVALWLSSPTVGQGESIEAVVRVTNTRRDPVWSYEGPCLTRPTVTAGLSAVLDPGLAPDGNAGEFKWRVIVGSDLLVGEFDRQSSRHLPDASGITVSVLADCGPVGPSYARVRAGRTVEQRWTWYPVDPFDGYERWFRPLPPGAAPVTVTWRYAGHGSEATVRKDRRAHRPITATAALTLTGTDPDLLSPQELVDRALADPQFAAWVEANPTRADWVDTDVEVWPGPDYPAQPRFAGLAVLAPNGVVEIALVRDLPGRPGVIGSAWVDPWTGEVLRFTTG